MITSVSDWAAFLHSCDALTGIPFIFAGGALMALGWRMWKFCVVITFTLIGMAVGVGLAEAPQQQVTYGLCGAVVLGLASFPPVQHSISLLGGLLGGALLHGMLEAFGLEGVALWVSTGLVVMVVTPLCAINRKQVIILITSFQGAVMLVSGLAILAHSEPMFRGTYEEMAEYSAIVTPFVLLVPTVMSIFLQMADVRQKERGN
ncbi:MAG: hypothetical protein IT449_08925 [Phycisphaerales bacterium]|nr:hypothetical protein [Phycisphaerales bacterium]